MQSVPEICCPAVVLCVFKGVREKGVPPSPLRSPETHAVGPDPGPLRAALTSPKRLLGSEDAVVFLMISRSS